MFTPDPRVTHQNASLQLSAGITAIDAGQTIISFAQTTSMDSSAVVCMLAWQRHALRRGVRLQFQQLPSNLTNLITLYGVTDLL